MLLPELSSTALAAITDVDPLVTSTSRACSPDVVPTLELVNEEMIDDNIKHGPSSNEIAPARLSVNHLTASWSHVKNNNCLIIVLFSSFAG